MTVFFCSSRRRHTICALVTEFRRVLFRSLRGARQPVAHLRREAGEKAETQRDIVDSRRREGGVDAVGHLDVDGRHHQAEIDGGRLKEPVEPDPIIQRSEESRVGKECVSTCSSRWSTSNEKENKKQNN